MRAVPAGVASLPLIPDIPVLILTVLLRVSRFKCCQIMGFRHPGGKGRAGGRPFQEASPGRAAVADGLERLIAQAHQQGHHLLQAEFAVACLLILSPSPKKKASGPIRH